MGIAEQHAVTFAAGLACEGIRPVVAIYSTFLQRAYDQIIHDVALQKLPVTFALDRGGLVGADGKTHQGAFDLSYLRCVPNLVVMAPSDENELRQALATGLHHDGPLAFRFPRGASLGLAARPSPAAARDRQGALPAPGLPAAHVVIVAAGTPGPRGAGGGRDARGRGHRGDRRGRPLREAARRGDPVRGGSQARRVVTVEEGALAGGFGSACLEAFERQGLLDKGLKVRRLGLPDAFVTHGDAAKQRAEIGIDAAGIAAAARELAGAREDGERRRRLGSGPLSWPAAASAPTSSSWSGGSPTPAPAHRRS